MSLLVIIPLAILGMAMLVILAQSYVDHRAYNKEHLGFSRDYMDEYGYPFIIKHTHRDYESEIDPKIWTLTGNTIHGVIHMDYNDIPPSASDVETTLSNKIKLLGGATIMEKGKEVTLSNSYIDVNEFELLADFLKSDRLNSVKPVGSKWISQQEHCVMVATLASGSTPEDILCSVRLRRFPEKIANLSPIMIPNGNKAWRSDLRFHPENLDRAYFPGYDGDNERPVKFIDNRDTSYWELATQPTDKPLFTLKLKCVYRQYDKQLIRTIDYDYFPYKENKFQEVSK